MSLVSTMRVIAFVVVGGPHRWLEGLVLVVGGVDVGVDELSRRSRTRGRSPPAPAPVLRLLLVIVISLQEVTLRPRPHTSAAISQKLINFFIILHIYLLLFYLVITRLSLSRRLVITLWPLSRDSSSCASPLSAKVYRFAVKSVRAAGHSHQLAHSAENATKGYVLPRAVPSSSLFSLLRALAALSTDGTPPASFRWPAACGAAGGADATKTHVLRLAATL